jgi:hypothetical protein
MSYHLTEEEGQAAGRAMLAAALEALGTFSDAIDRNEVARLVVRALAAARRAEESEVGRLAALKGKRVFIDTQPHDAVATAFWMWSENVGLDINEVSASSIAGDRYLGLAQGLAAARAMTEACDLLSGDCDEFAFSSRGAVHLGSFLDAES